MALQITTETAATITRRLRRKGGVIKTKESLKNLVDALAAADVNHNAGPGACDMDALTFVMNTGVNYTGFTPKRIGQVAIVYCFSSGTDPTLKCGTSVTFNGTNNTATFQSVDSALILVASTLTRWRIIATWGTVSYSTT